MAFKTNWSPLSGFSGGKVVIVSAYVAGRAITSSIHEQAAVLTLSLMALAIKDTEQGLTA